MRLEPLRRLLHATHANATGKRRICVLLNFTPDWERLPEDIRAHLISQVALPAPAETVPTSATTSKLVSGQKRT